MSNPTIGVMIGDPGGVGPEVCVKALFEGDLRRHGQIVLIGSVDVVARAAKIVGCDLPVIPIRASEASQRREGLAVIDPGYPNNGEFPIGEASAASGMAVKAWMDAATELSEAGTLDGWIMAPINTESMRLSKVVQDLDDLQPPNTYMFRLSGPLRVVPITEHIPIRDIAASVTATRIRQLITLTEAHLKKWGVENPRLAVAGLNPHAMFEEDIEIIKPSVQAARSMGIDVAGPIAPDSVFRQCVEGKYDAVITMYHDQGQIALKTAAFEGACTVYLGLPYVQLSVPHGTAYDIAGRGVAQHKSISSAMRTALDLAAGRGFLNQGAVN